MSTLCWEQTSKVSSQSAAQRGLISNTLNADTLVNQYNSYHDASSTSTFEGEVLAYMTPWNPAGYEFAKIFSNKLTWISPTWLQLRRDSESNIILTGTHDIDSHWMDVVRSRGDAKLVPRVVLEINSIGNSDPDAIAHVLDAAMRQYHFDGFVFEFPIVQKAYTFIQSTCSLFKKLNSNVFLILVSGVPAAISHSRFLTQLIESSLIDRVSLMTYDFNKGNYKPIAPTSWISSSLSSLESSPLLMKSVLMGIPFYGYDNKGNAMIWSDVMSILSSCKQVHMDDYEEFIDYRVKIRWNSTNQEHEFDWKSCPASGIAWSNFPSLMFIDARLQLADQFEVAGVSIWEIGQGPPILFDLL